MTKSRKDSTDIFQDFLKSVQKADTGPVGEKEIYKAWMAITGWIAQCVETSTSDGMIEVINGTSFRKHLSLSED